MRCGDFKIAVSSSRLSTTPIPNIVNAKNASIPDFKGINT